MRSSLRAQSWIIAFPVIALLLWSVVYPNVAVIADTSLQGPLHDSWRKAVSGLRDQQTQQTYGFSRYCSEE